MEYNEKLKKSNYMSLEYFLGFVIAFSLWGYHLFNTGLISQDIAKKCILKINKDDFKIYGLENSYFNLKRVNIEIKIFIKGLCRSSVEKF
jgi:hypothetical protein